MEVEKRGGEGGGRERRGKRGIRGGKKIREEKI